MFEGALPMGSVKMRFAIAIAILAIAAPAFAQDAAPPAAPGWSYPQLTIPETSPLPIVPPATRTIYVPASQPGPIPTGLPERTVMVDELPPVSPEMAPGQQHWVSLNLGVFQPFAARIGVKVWERPQNSLWIEAFGGSELYNGMYGFGIRMQHTLWSFGNSDQLMIAPGFGAHILPDWDAVTRTLVVNPNTGFEHYRYSCKQNTLYYLFGDVDLSWLHDFGPHFGFELGVKFGLAGRVSGTVGRDYPSFEMWGKDVYPVASLYTGLRF
jgi:hypothetical protein